VNRQTQRVQSVAGRRAAGTGGYKTTTQMAT
jgi:hypothetical protein